MASDFEIVIELMTSIESNILEVCSLAAKLALPTDLILNLDGTKLSVINSKKTLLNLSLDTAIKSTKFEKGDSIRLNKSINKDHTSIKYEKKDVSSKKPKINFDDDSFSPLTEVKLDIDDEVSITNKEGLEDNQSDCDSILSEHDIESIEINKKSLNKNVQKIKNSSTTKSDIGYTNKVKAEQFLEYLESLRNKNHKLTLEGVLTALETKNFEYFIKIENKDGEIMERCGVCNRANLPTLFRHIEFHFVTKSCSDCKGMLYIQFQSDQHKAMFHYDRCTFCNRPIKNARKHEEICPLRKVSAGLTCPSCEKTFLQLSHLRAHVRNFHEQSTENLVCPTCGKDNFKNIRCYKDHIQKHTDQVIHCKICNQQFKTRRKLFVHKKEVHIDVIGEFCDVCGVIVPSIATHNTLKHKPVHCHDCGKQYSSKETLNKHIRLVHKKNLRIECDLCNKELSCKTALLKHMRTVHKIANWTVANSKMATE